MFIRMLSGQAPDGRSLTGKAIDSEKRRAATDLTFSTPKSVSIAALVQQDERVLEAHHQAVAKALTVLEERYAQTRISTEAGRTKVMTGNTAAAVFTHSTSREVGPQLHSYCVVMNATQLADGRWFSLSNEAAIAFAQHITNLAGHQKAQSQNGQSDGARPTLDWEMDR